MTWDGTPWGFFVTVVWGVALGMGFTVGSGLLRWIFGVGRQAASKGGP